MKKIFHSLTLAMFLALSIFSSCSEEETFTPKLSRPQPSPNSPPPNHVAPIARAGNDTTIYVPFSSHTLNGGASTGSVFSYQWKWIKGPSLVNVIDLGSEIRPKRYVGGLVQVGVYEFELTVTDSYNLSSKDTVKVTVSEPPCTSATKELILKDQKWISPWYTQISLNNVFSYLPKNSYIKNFYIKRDGSDEWQLVIPWNPDSPTGSGQHSWEYVHYFGTNTWVLEIYPPDFDADDTPDVKIEYCN